MSTPRILSIQSHVVCGYVGNKSSVFPLHLHGFQVSILWNFESIQCSIRHYLHSLQQCLINSFTNSTCHWGDQSAKRVWVVQYNLLPYWFKTWRLMGISPRKFFRFITHDTRKNSGRCYKLRPIEQPHPIQACQGTDSQGSRCHGFVWCTKGKQCKLLRLRHYRFNRLLSLKTWNYTDSYKAISSLGTVKWPFK